MILLWIPRVVDIYMFYQVNTFLPYQYTSFTALRRLVSNNNNNNDSVTMFLRLNLCYCFRNSLKAWLPLPVLSSVLSIEVRAVRELQRPLFLYVYCFPMIHS